MNRGVKDESAGDAALISVLVVDDSEVSRRLLVHILKADKRIQVIGEVGDGQEALEFLKRTVPDVVLMDIHMPRMDGFEATRLIMETTPVPVVVCSATSNMNDLALTFRLMEAGAIACVEKPPGPQHPGFARMVAHLLDTVRLMSEVRVVKRWARPAIAQAPVRSIPPAIVKRSPVGIRLIGIGASTGGPPVIQKILSGLPADFPVPIVIVQHIAPGFLPGLVDWLNTTTAFHAQLGAYGIVPLPRHVYLAPDGLQMGIGAHGQILLNSGPAENGLRPAVSYLFRSMAEELGPAALGVILTGMGKDGAAELKLMKDSGASTIAQDFGSSVVHGMPGEAIAINGTTHVSPADRIADLLVTLCRES